MTEEINITAGEQRDIIIADTADTRLCFKQQAESTLRLYLFQLDDKDSLTDITIEQTGENCITEIYGLGILRQNQQTKCNTHVYHRVGKGTSRQLMKYILTGNSNASFTGHLLIAQDAQQTDAQQSNRNLLLSTGAKISTKPQLEIYADNVKASHGATTGQIDESSVFYMQQRGLSIKEAKRLLIMAFAEEVIGSMADKQKQAEFQQHILDRLNQIDL